MQERTSANTVQRKRIVGIFREIRWLVKFVVKRVKYQVK